MSASKTYRGRRTLNGVLVTVDGNALTVYRSLAARNHSPDGFNWGYSGSGPAQLALAILLDVTDDRDYSLDHYQDFKRQFVAGFGDTWGLTESQVREWLSLSKTRV